MAVTQPLILHLLPDTQVNIQPPVKVVKNVGVQTDPWGPQECQCADSCAIAKNSRCFLSPCLAMPSPIAKSTPSRHCYVHSTVDDASTLPSDSSTAVDDLDTTYEPSTDIGHDASAELSFQE